MKALLLGFLMATLLVFSSFDSQAQYKGPRDYFPKNNPAPPPNNATPPAPPKKVAPVRPAQHPLTFKDLKVDTQFFLLSDTNRITAFKKLTATTAKNVKSGKSEVIKSTTPVRR